MKTQMTSDQLARHCEKVFGQWLTSTAKIIRALPRERSYDRGYWTGYRHGVEDCQREVVSLPGSQPAARSSAHRIVGASSKLHYYAECVAILNKAKPSERVRIVKALCLLVGLNAKLTQPRHE
jgi:hypothetical protein